jgi:hypothetical protein
MTAQQHVSQITAQPAKAAQPSLRIVGVIPPEPRYAPGTYEVRLELSRPLTVHERRALPRLARRMHTVGRELVVGDTTLERVRERASELSCLVRAVESEGSRLQQDAERREQAYRRRVLEEQARLTALARSIRFDVADAS